MAKMYTLSKRMVSLVMAVVLIILSFVIVAYAGEDGGAEQEPIIRYNVINDCYVSISKSGISVNCSAVLRAQYSTSLKIVMVLQKDTSSGWTNVKTWTATGTGKYLDLSESKVINILNTYRLKVTFTAGSESVTKYAYY